MWLLCCVLWITGTQSSETPWVHKCKPYWIRLMFPPVKPLVAAA